LEVVFCTVFSEELMSEDCHDDWVVGRFIELYELHLTALNGHRLTIDLQFLCRLARRRRRRL
jgi:hypothetical protein